MSVLCHISVLQCQCSTLSVFYNVSVLHVYNVSVLQCQFSTMSVFYNVSVLHCQFSTISVFYNVSVLQYQYSHVIMKSDLLSLSLPDVQFTSSLRHLCVLFSSSFAIILFPILFFPLNKSTHVIWKSVQWLHSNSITYEYLQFTTNCSIVPGSIVHNARALIPRPTYTDLFCH